MKFIKRLESNSLKRIILLISCLFQLQDALACKLAPGSTLVEDNITAARVTFFCTIFVVLISIYVIKYNNWKKLLRSLLIVLFHPFVWFENYADCGYTLKYSSIVYTVIVLLIVLFLMVKRKLASGKEKSSR